MSSHGGRASETISFIHSLLNFSTLSQSVSGRREKKFACRHDGTTGASCHSGSELEVKPIDDATPVIIRIVESYQHGSDFRYDIEYYGLQPGEFNLIQFLQRKDESDFKDIPPVTVAIRSILPKDRIEPNSVRMQSMHRLGGYKFWVITGAIIWDLV